MAREKNDNSETEAESSEDQPELARDGDAEGGAPSEAEAGADGDAASVDTDEAAEPDAETETAEGDPEPQAPEQAPVAATPSDTDPANQPVRRVGFVPVVLGGIVAGAIGFAAGVALDLGGDEEDPRLLELTQTVTAQGDELAQTAEALETTAADIRAAIPAPVDLSGVEAGLAELSTDLGGLVTALAALEARVVELEERPIITGDDAGDQAAIAAAVTSLRGLLVDQQSENEALAEEIRSLAAEAEARIAEAEARADAAASQADAAVASASSGAALSELRISIAAGTPFADPLAELAEAQGITPPDVLVQVAETGIPTLEDIRTRFPAAARAALPVALQPAEDATAGERLGAFLRSQVGGRALEPQEGDDPDAVLSRAEAAVGVGDLEAALTELTALPDPALEEMSDWIGLVTERIAALEAFEALSASAGN